MYRAFIGVYTCINRCIWDLLYKAHRVLHTGDDRVHRSSCSSPAAFRGCHDRRPTLLNNLSECAGRCWRHLVASLAALLQHLVSTQLCSQEMGAIWPLQYHAQSLSFSSNRVVAQVFCLPLLAMQHVRVQGVHAHPETARVHMSVLATGGAWTLWQVIWF